MSIVLSRYIYFPLTERLRKTPVTRHLQSLLQSQWSTEEEIRERTERQLAETLEAARREVPFYREKIAGGGPITPASALDVLRTLPVLARKDLFTHRQDLRAGGGARAERAGTCDVRGDGLEIAYTRDYLARTTAAQWRGRGWWGMRRGDPMLTLWGRAVQDPRMARSIARRERLRNWLRISAFELSHRHLARHQGMIRRFRPEFIYGYSSAIYQLALFYSEHTLPPPPGLEAIFFTAEPLPGFQRRVIQETLRAPTACEYGSSEAGAFAFECREGGVHVAAENVLLEVLRNGIPVPPGEEGDMVVTVFHNRAMPLIRHGVGDRARWLPGRCACGRNLPRIQLAEARTAEPAASSAAPAGAGHLFDYILIELIDRGMRGVRQFMVVEKAVDHFVVQVVPGPGKVPECLALFERRMRERLGEKIEVEFEIVPEIPQGSAGKIRYFRSEVEPRPGAQAGVPGPEAAPGF
jgi:phenylacetate-coenzyme A ligase PaaK-like adenylate-forming protein